MCGPLGLPKRSVAALTDETAIDAEFMPLHATVFTDDPDLILDAAGAATNLRRPGLRMRLRRHRPAGQPPPCDRF